MPSVSAKQHRFMEAVAHNPKFAAKVKVSPKVGKDFVAADAGMPVKKMGAQHRHESGQFHSDPLEQGYTKP